MDIEYLDYKSFELQRVGTLLLPRALLVAIRLQAFTTLVLVHLQTALLLEISHG